MVLKPTNDLCIIEEVEAPAAPTPSGLIVTVDPTVNAKKRARVLAAGPGAIQNGARVPMPCQVGDIVLVGPVAGFKAKDAGKEYWFINALPDILAVVRE